MYKARDKLTASKADVDGVVDPSDWTVLPHTNASRRRRHSISLEHEHKKIKLHNEFLKFESSFSTPSTRH